MTRDEVRNLMHDYFDNLLSAEERSTVESYLEEYEDIAQEYELLGKLLDRSQKLPIGIKTPDTVINKISDELLSQSLEKIESDKQQKLREFTENVEKEGEQRKKLKGQQKRKTNTSNDTSSFQLPKRSIKVPLIFLLIVIIIVGGYFAYGFLSTNLPWNLKQEYGTYQITPSSSNKQTLDEQETLTTLDSSKVDVIVPNAGKLELRSFSSLQLIKGTDTDNIALLTSGRVDAYCKIDAPRLTIKTRPVDVIARGGDFSVMLDDVGNVNVRTQNGLALLSNEIEELLLIQDHNCKILSDGNIGIPYHVNSDTALVQLILEASFNKNIPVDLDKLLSLVTPLDGITLLYLIKEAKNPADRLTIFLKLNEFYPVPSGVTQDGIINLNPDMFDLWRNEIEWQI